MRNVILIDGSNFYYKLKDLKLHNKIFDYRAFCSWLTEGQKYSCTYYVGAVRQQEGDAKSKKMYAKQRAFLSSLKKQGVRIELGYIMKSDGYHEKGVDVKIAVDLLTGAYENRYDKVLLVSSDTDLIPAIEKVIQKRKIVEYIGFSHLKSFALAKRSSSSRLLHKKDLEKFTG
ncbi:MAG: hypothetical protein A2900_03475 [Candidatus Chisholmbacteria bacterium RIFCSPLOWO2_01_FULL_50_28]|uniref:NYN domain-containing protein n=1 Tax=Candidatus Chisholmbacteria bacterium RIFCSPHIGHO2_01_FULL_52_32 TaxID=1797591 RepID=A0A1G1VSY0_9BACT|nr:MAG: hypothetical protein A2786_03270 [Candidatus Chisholmbacteria bacterium RIFCSPHIGHO2_01_FULL_52_32]OGY20137.1 MAG: hypothetical protein A2900_03475 [Candidatus Chisholmbacteria bacterium RIFCSPLOWO2_01_FULL_50_28]